MCVCVCVSVCMCTYSCGGNHCRNWGAGNLTFSPTSFTRSTEGADLPDHVGFLGLSRTSLRDKLLPRTKLVFSVKKEVKF